MTRADQANYRLAQDLLTEGIWTIDAELGLIYGVKRKPFNRINSWGYVQIKFRRPQNWRTECQVLAHRVIWEFVHGPVPPPLQINHRNGDKTDNRISNLEAITPSANMAHSYQAGLHAPSRPNAKLTNGQAVDIYRRCHDGEHDDSLAAEYGVKRSAINNIRNGWSWTHLTGHKPSRPRPPRNKDEDQPRRTV